MTVVATDHEALAQAVYESPDDDAPRLILADYLDESGLSGGDQLRVPGQLVIEEVTGQTQVEFLLLWEPLGPGAGDRLVVVGGLGAEAEECERCAAKPKREGLNLWPRTAVVRRYGQWLCGGCMYSGRRERLDATMKARRRERATTRRAAR